MFLVTTADEKSWKYNEPILFLGEWCKLYSRKHIWSNLEYDIVSYHWDDRKKYYDDYKYLTEVYENYLESLSLSLNKIHGLNHSKRYWRIIIGPWLRSFIDVLFDRYCSIKSAMKDRRLISTLIMNYDIFEWIPKDYNQFHQSFTSDQWNHLIYSEIIKQIDGISYEVIVENNHPDINYNKVIGHSIKSQIKKLIINGYARIIPDQFNRNIFISSYFDLSNLVKLQISLGQMPYIYGPVVQTEDIVVNKDMRNQMIMNYKKSEFERTLDSIIPWQMPKAYLEAYEQASILSEKYFPKKIKSIFTANAYAADDIFKIWAAGKTEQGIELYIGQHGGNIGVGLWEQREDHQIAISDKYFSWGWDSDDSPHIKSLPASKLLNHKKIIPPKSSGDILIAMASFPRYFYSSFSMPIAGQFLNYYSQQIKLLKLLNPKILEIIKIRLNVPDFDWELKSRFSDNGYHHNLEGTKIGIYKRLKKSRLCISTQNATVFIETFSANFPTIMIWDPEYYEIRDSASKYYNELEKVGILHYTSESAAEVLNEIYQNPMEWWMQNKIQAAKNKFCSRYAYIGDNWLKEWKDEIKNETYIEN